MQASQPSIPTWTDRLGIRHLTDEEWAQYQQEKREEMQKRWDIQLLHEIHAQSL